MNETNNIHNPKVTVISGYYNRVDCVSESVASILEQTFTDFEYIIFEDCSTDGTRAALRKINDPRLKLIEHEENIGFVHGMIAAVQQAHGEIIAIHGSGDISSKERLAEQVAIFDQFPNVGLVGCCRQTVDLVGNLLDTKCPGENITFATLQNGNVFSHGEMAFRKSTYDAVGGYRPEFTYTQDYDLWLRISKITDIYVVPKVLYRRYIRQNGVSFQADKLVLQAKFNILALKLIVLSSNDQNDLLKRVRDEGIDKVVSVSEPEIQQKLLRRIIILGVIGNWHDVAQLLQKLQNISIKHALWNFLAYLFFFSFSKLDPNGKILPAILQKRQRLK